MPRVSTDRLKLNPPLGNMPVLQFLQPGQLVIDASYQRSVEAGDSQMLIRRIAQHWNWDLCQPLVISRREGQLFVIDGQHRLAAARLRGDIAQLPCVVIDYASAADEAASFVHLNQQRRPLNQLDLFKAALASEDANAMAIMAALERASLALAPHTNVVSWKPGMVGNIGGIRQAWQQYGAVATGEALKVLATAFAGEVLRYAGTIFPGLVAVCVMETKGGGFDDGRFASFSAKVGSRGQERLREDVLLESAGEAGLGRTQAAIRVLTELWWPERRTNRVALQRSLASFRAEQADPVPADLAFEPDDDGMAWCAQCDRRVTVGHASACESRWCSLRKTA